MVPEQHRLGHRQDYIAYVKTDSRTIEYRLPMAKDGEATVTYTVRYKS
jgi:ASC-1-like (ASCH) protein